MRLRRVVTGHDAYGNSVVASDAEIKPLTIALAPGMELYRLWGSDGIMAYPDDRSEPCAGPFFPPSTGFRFIALTIPPDSSAQLAEVPDIDAAAAEAETKLPGLLGHMEPEDPGFHTSDTVDLLYVASGRVVSRLDNGVEIALEAGDTFVRSGTRHAWRNPGSEPCRIIGVLLGAKRTE